MESSQIPQPNNDIIWKILDGEAVLVSPKHGKVRVLNSVGTAIWKLLDGKHSINDIEACLVNNYGISPEQASNDVQAFLTDLMAKELIEFCATRKSISSRFAYPQLLSMLGS